MDRLPEPATEATEVELDVRREEVVVPWALLRHALLCFAGTNRYDYEYSCFRTVTFDVSSVA